MKIQRILAATDFSEHGGHAVRRAALLAAQSGATLRLLHALPGAALTWALLRYSGTEAESSLRDAAQMLLGEVPTNCGRVSIWKWSALSAPARLTASLATFWNRFSRTCWSLAHMARE